MAPKKQQIGKGKAVDVSSNGAEVVRQVRAKRSDPEQIERDDEAAWVSSIKNRGVKSERHIIDDGMWPAEYAPFQAIRHQGMQFWFQPNPEYNNALVEEFYKNMSVPEEGEYSSPGAPGARITSKIGNTAVFVDVAEIAAAWEYVRPTRPTNFPRPDEMFDQDVVATYLYGDRRNYKIPHWPGRFKPHYRFLNQLMCYNLYPRGKEGAPQKSVGNLLFSFMAEDTVCDWALYAFRQMWNFRDAPITLRMPFPCLLTKILRGKKITAKRFSSNDERVPGDMDSSIIKRSLAQSRAIDVSVLTPPPPSATTKAWMEKIFACLTCIARSQRKLKKGQRQLARGQADLRYGQRHLQAQISGQNPGPFRPIQWPELEVSDDFADEEDDHSDATGD